MLELQRRGITIPGDIALTGFNNISPSECLLPLLSTVHYPFETMMTKAIEMLIDLMK
ncbi:MAG: substrate-binding domain-containing protein [Spirochaetales bacterium]|nr:substrate-binding domain-containing protein [Spirochaetales bacterium]